MKLYQNLLWISGLIFFIFSGCSKDPVEISNVPSISFVSVTPTLVKEYTDSLVFTIDYEDGDGDLGENTSGVENFFLVDSRNEVTYKFRIPQLAPGNSNIAIRGKLSVKLDNTAITDGSPSQSFSYKIYVKDRSGNLSNTINSSVIKVTK